MTDQFVDANKMVPITPPPELVQQWLADSPEDGEFCIADYIATQAARWGSDKELEACCEWLRHEDQGGYVHCLASNWLHEARRPEPPSLKAQALTVLDDASDRLDAAHENIIRRALESLPS